MGILLCEQNFWDVWIRNKSVRAEIGQILHTHTQTHTHTTAAKLVVRISVYLLVKDTILSCILPCIFDPPDCVQVYICEYSLFVLPAYLCGMSLFVL